MLFEIRIVSTNERPALQRMYSLYNYMNSEGEEREDRAGSAVTCQRGVCVQGFSVQGKYHGWGKCRG